MDLGWPAREGAAYYSALVNDEASHLRSADREEGERSPDEQGGARALWPARPACPGSEYACTFQDRSTRTDAAMVPLTGRRVAVFFLLTMIGRSGGHQGLPEPHDDCVAARGGWGEPKDLAGCGI
jgi:hypothetical protein